MVFQVGLARDFKLFRNLGQLVLYVLGLPQGGECLRTRTMPGDVARTRTEQGGSNFVSHSWTNSSSGQAGDEAVAEQVPSMPMEDANLALNWSRPLPESKVPSTLYHGRW